MPEVLKPGVPPPHVGYVGGASWKHGNTLTAQWGAEAKLLGDAVKRGLRSGAATPLSAPPGAPVGLNERCRGWLKLMWVQAMTPDDWSSSGTPHEWWDKTSGPPMTNFPRFHLSECGYALALMADRTPAWREAYSRILDELVQRHTSHWGAVDWLTQFGDDPDRARYPERWKGTIIPKHVWGNYNTPGWTANGIAPYGLQPDPIGCDGMLFYKGFLNLTMSTYVYVSGDHERWDRPWFQTGVADQKFEWTHQRLATFIHDQWAERPEGVHCENTKVWPFCLSAAGLGLQLYDKLKGGSKHGVAQRWYEYVKKHYVKYNKDGEVGAIALYYDPVIKHAHFLPEPGAAQPGLGVAFYSLAQDPKLARQLYEAAVRESGWGDPARPVAGVSGGTLRNALLALVLAREFGDVATEQRLRGVLERVADPRYFGDGMFGFWFHLGEQWPRGQLAALMMVAEAGGVGDWQRVFRAPREAHAARFSEPTVEGVDFPTLGVCEARNDPHTGVLTVATYAATPSKAGQPTRFRVTQLPGRAAVRVERGGAPFADWEWLPGRRGIEIRCTVGPHRFAVHTGAGGARL